jgi:hypothetical protein
MLRYIGRSRGSRQSDDDHHLSLDLMGLAEFGYETLG